MRKIIPSRWDVSPERDLGRMVYENGFIPPRWDLTSTQVRYHLRGINFLQVNSYCRDVPPRQDCAFGLDSVCFYKLMWKSAVPLIKFDILDVY